MQAGHRAEQILRDVFGYPAFRGQQREIVTHVADGGDALVLMPTGGGKSLCYQIPALLREGMGVVVSPLIALMHDQVAALEEAGVRAAALNSSMSWPEVQAAERKARQGELDLLYVAPERLLTERCLDLLGASRLALFAIDEAHCVSQWGHDFRPDYIRLAVLAERFAQVPRIALTATADALTRKEIIDRLKLQNARVFISSFDRPNIRYRIADKESARRQLLEFIRAEHPDDAGIVYCLSRNTVEETAKFLAGHGINAIAYHAGLDTETREENQNRFIREEGVVMVATIAFGMGIDKPDVRFVAHLDMPKNIEGYYQETGRAGRDGEPADAWMCYGLQDVVNQRRMIDESPADEVFKQGQRGKLDALLALAEATDCRRVRLLNYFGEASEPCGNCDNCLNPPQTWDATEAARKLLSCIYRFHQRGERFGAGHLIDVLRGKATDKTRQYRHESLSTWGCGADLSEQQWRAVLRQLIALGHVAAEGEFNTLALQDSARAVLKGEVEVRLREAEEKKPRGKAKAGRPAKPKADPSLGLDADAQERFEALKAWRSEVAKEHGLPAYVIFQNTTLAEMARAMPGDLAELGAISGVGAKKLEAYGREILRVLGR